MLGLKCKLSVSGQPGFGLIRISVKPSSIIARKSASKTTGIKTPASHADLATGISGPLCSKPECTRTDRSCNAYGLSMYDGRIYWVEYVYGSRSYRIVSAAPDGTAQTTVRILDQDVVSKAMRNRCVMFTRSRP